MSENKIRIRSVKYNFVMNALLKISSFIFPLITFPYVSRVLGAECNGKITFATSFVSYFAMFAVLGIPTYGVKACAACRDDKDKLSKTVQELLIILFVLTAISYVAFLATVFCVPSLYEDRLLLLITSVTILLNSFGVEWFYQSIEQYGYITYRNIAVKIFSVVLMFICVKSQNDYIVYGIISVLGSVGSNIINIIRIRKYIYFKRYKNYDVVRHLKPIGMLFLYVAAVSVYTNLDSVMLKFMTHDSEVGYYGAAIKIKQVLQGGVTALGTVLLPKAAYYLQNNERQRYDNIMKKSFDFIILSSISIVAFFEIESEDCILLLAGEQYVNAIPVMRWIIPTVIFIGISSTTGTQILIPSGQDKYATLSTVYGAITDVILNWSLIPKFGAVGAAVATLIAEIVVAFTQIIILRKEILKYIDFKNLLKSVIIMLIAACTTLVEKRFFRADILILRIVFSCVTFYGVFFIAAVILQEKIIYSEVKKLILKRH